MDENAYSDAEVLQALGISAPTASTPTIPADKAAEFAAARQAVQKAQSDVDLYGRLGTALSFGGQGLTLGLADEALAGLSALTGGPSYSEQLAAQQAEREAMRSLYPITAGASEIGGGITSALATGPLGQLRGVFGASRAAPSLASELLLGGGAPTVAKLAGAGAVQGGIYGAASAEPGERLPGGVMGAGVGAVASPVIGKTAQYATEKFGGVLAKAGTTLKEALAKARTTLGSERGAITLGGDFNATALYTPEEIQLAKVLSQTTPEAISTAEQSLQRAGELGKPVFLPEAVQSPSLFQEAKLIANSPASIEIAKTAIEQRAADATARITESLDVVNPERNVTAGANRLVEGAKSLLEDLGIARKKATKGLYETAFERTPELTAENAVKLVQNNPRIQQAIKAVRKELPELAEKSDTSLEVLHQAQQYLSGKARSLKNKFTAGKVTEARNALMKAIKEESSDYAEATSTFAQMSKGLTAKEQSKIGFLANISPNRPESIGRVFALDADIISSLRDDFVAAGRLSEWESGVRAYLQRAVEKAQDGRNPINKIIGSPALRNKLRAALSDKYDAIIEPLTIEQTILKGQREYFAGSPTAPLLQRERALEESLGAIQKAMQVMKNPIKEGGKLLAEVLGGSKRPEFYEGYARLLFSAPEQGLETIGKVGKLAEALRNARQVGETVGSVAGTAAGRETAAGLDIMQEQLKAKRSKQLGMGAMGTASLTSELADSDYTDDEILKALGQEEPAQPAKPISLEKQEIKVGKQNISIPTGDKYAPADLVKAVIMAESAGNANAVSPKGAGGLMQIMPATAKILGVKNRFDPVENVDGGSRYLKEQLVAAAQETGKEDPKLAAAAYNWGPGNLSKAIRQVKAEGEDVTWDNIKSIVKVPEETRTYVDRVMLLRKYDDYDLAKIAAKVGEQKLDAVLNKFKTGKKFTVGDILDELGIDAKSVKVKRNNVLQSASNLTEA
jgi:soluble lytic murein transglycosylase-like protein